MVAGAARALDAAFESRFEIALNKGEIARTANTADLALLASGVVHTLSIRARAGEKKSELERVIDVYLVALCGPERKARRPTGGGIRASTRQTGQE